VFKVGDTAVTCTAVDKAGNKATSTFTVTVTYTAPTAVALGSTGNAGVGVPGVVLTATVTPRVAGGTVAFVDGGTVIAGCQAQPITSGGSSCVTSFSIAGSHVITAAYSGDLTHASSRGSAPIDVTATPTFFEIVYGYLIQFAHFFHLLGL
jgi:hypothetical protein